MGRWGVWLLEVSLWWLREALHVPRILHSGHIVHYNHAGFLVSAVGFRTKLYVV